MNENEVKRFAQMVTFFASKDFGVVVSLLPFDANVIMVVDRNDMVKFMGRGATLEDAMNDLVNEMVKEGFI